MTLLPLPPLSAREMTPTISTGRTFVKLAQDACRAMEQGDISGLFSILNVSVEDDGTLRWVGQMVTKHLTKNAAKYWLFSTR